MTEISGAEISNIKSRLGEITRLQSKKAGLTDSSLNSLIEIVGELLIIIDNLQTDLSIDVANLRDDVANLRNDSHTH
jgi:hypothetical protein